MMAGPSLQSLANDRRKLPSSVYWNRPAWKDELMLGAFEFSRNCEVDLHVYVTC